MMQFSESREDIKRLITHLGRIIIPVEYNTEDEWFNIIEQDELIREKWINSVVNKENVLKILKQYLKEIKGLNTLSMRDKNYQNTILDLIEDIQNE